MNEAPSMLHASAVGVTPAAQQRLLVLHGIYGRGRNWQSIARAVTAARPDWSALLVDLRLHGESPAFDPPHTLASAADDVRRLIDGEETRGPAIRAILGHSFGGKVALAVAATPPASLRQAWVIDATPGTHPPARSTWKMLNDVRSLPSTSVSRADAIVALERLGWPVGVASWMATNLRPTGADVNHAFQWMLDFDALEGMLRSYYTTDLWHVIESPPPQVDIHIVKAEDSNTLDEAACARIARAEATHGRVDLHRVAGGHWLNADNPDAIVELLTKELHREGR
jgi:esterase